MFSRMRTEKYTRGFSERIERLRSALDAADAVVVGAGSGLSAAAGYDYSGARFERYFSDFAEKYGIEDMYSGGFYPFPSPEEYWAYWSRYIFINRYTEPPSELYRRLLGLLDGRDHFVITTNVDHCFQRAGFDKKRLFYTQGDYGLFQCSKPCCCETYDNEAIIREMVERQEGMRIPSELIPRCPHCGEPMTMNLRADDRFVEDEGWHRAAERYADFLRRCRGLRVLYLELGVGMNTPAIIKYPFMQMTAENPQAVYACINRDSYPVPPVIAERSLILQGDIADILLQL